MARSSTSPHRWARIDDFLIFREQDRRRNTIKTVFLNYIPVARFDIDKVNERKLAAIELVECRLADQKTAGEICGFHRNTISKIIQIKEHLGIEAVLRDERGLKSAYKYVESVRSHIQQLLEKWPDWSDQAIADQASIELEMTVSRSSVARIRVGEENTIVAQELPGKQELLELARIAESIDMKKIDSRQLALNFERDPVLREKQEEFSREESPQAEKQTDKELLLRLETGERSHFAGGFMHHLFLHEIGFSGLLSPLQDSGGVTYRNAEILATLYHSVTQQIPSIEALKLENASEFGLLIGCARSPEKETIRERLIKMAEKYVSDSLTDGFAHRLLELNRIDTEVFFIDGHFLPYYGLQVIAKGYFTVRRLAMKGNELYAVTDLSGKPLFFITESNEIDFRPIIGRCADKLIDYGIDRPMLVFDRGGYGIHFFKQLSEKADFVTWAKYVGDKSLGRFHDDSFHTGLFFADKRYLVAEELRTVTESIQTARKEGRKIPVSVQLRLVVLKNVATGDRLGIYTSDTEKPACDIGYYMLQRWGDSENFFKEMMSRYNLDYHPGYDIEQLKSQPLVDNPEVVIINKAVKILGREIQELEKNILVCEAKYARRADKRLLTKKGKLKLEIQEKQNDIAQFEKRLITLPKKVSILSILSGKPMSRCDLEKKRLYDLMQIMAFHSRESLVKIFERCYDDNRDRKQVLDMITARPGYVKLVGQTLVIILDWIENRKHRDAAIRLCQLLNQKSFRLAGRLNVKLFFHVSSIPHYGSKKIQ